MTTLDESLRSLRDGRSTANHFFQNTQALWNRLARYLLRRWRAPEWVAPEEIVQELMLGAWQFVWSYDETRGVPLSHYVKWNAIDYAKKKLHRMRGAKLSGDADRNPGRWEIPLSRLSSRSDDDSTVDLDDFLVQEAQQSDVVEVKRNYERAQESCRSVVEAWVLESLVEGYDLAESAVRLYDDPLSRSRLGFRSEKQAGRAVAEAAVALADRMADAA